MNRMPSSKLLCFMDGHDRREHDNPLVVRPRGSSFVKKQVQKIICFFVGYDWQETDDPSGHSCYVCGVAMAEVF